MEAHIERGVTQRGVAARAEGGCAGLTAQRLSALAPPVGAVSEEGMDLRVGDSIIQARAVRASELRSVTAFRRTPLAFDRRPDLPAPPVAYQTLVTHIIGSSSLSVVLILGKACRRC